MSGLSEQESKQLVELLNKLEPGFLPFEIFYSIIRLLVTPTFLIVPLFEDNGVLKVQLLDRESNDPHWAGQVALPGKILLSTDENLEAVTQRLIQSEIPSAKFKTAPTFCGHVFEKIPRGKEISLINYVLLSEPPAEGKLYDVENLPDNIIETEIKRVIMAVEHYKRTK